MAWRGKTRYGFGPHGDYGHVASKNGCGAVMGNKRPKAVAIVRGSKALRAADPRGLFMAAEEISHGLQHDPSTRSLYEYGTLPGVSGLSRLGALPIKNYTTSVVPDGVDMEKWTAQGLREGFDHRGHQCNAWACITATPRSCPPGRHQGSWWTSRSTRAGPGGLGHWLYRSGGRVVAQHADRSRLRGCQRIRLAHWLGNGVPGKGLHHQRATWRPGSQVG